MGEQQKKSVRERKFALLDFIDKVSFFQVFIFWIVMVFLFAGVYFFLAVSPDHALQYRGNIMTPNAEGFVNSVYYSFITVTTTGYGDISPSGLSKLFAIVEVIFGVIIEGILISKLVGFKQETILEEIYNINYEEAFTNYRRGLALVRTDIVMMMEKIEAKTLKQRELKDLWIVFSGLDQTLTNIKNMIVPNKKETSYNKKLDVAKLELILSSMKLTLHKVVELVKTLKNRGLDWRDELLLTSIYYDIQVIKDINEYEFKRSVDRKVIDKLNALRILLDELEAELKAEKQYALRPVDSEEFSDEHIDVPLPPAAHEKRQDDAALLHHLVHQEHHEKQHEPKPETQVAESQGHIEILPPDHPDDIKQNEQAGLGEQEETKEEKQDNTQDYL